jgi:hypothetical protein
MNRKIALALAFAGLLALVSGGCGNDDSTSPKPTPTPGSPVFDNPDSLMATFKSAYTTMSLEKYRAVLHPGFRFLFSPADITRLNLPQSDFLRSEDLGAMANIFSGESIPGDYGTVPGVSAVIVVVFERQGEWTDTGTGDADFPHTLRGLFAVEIDFQRSGDATTLVLHGQQAFYVVGRDSTVGGATKTYYRLCGQRDLTSIAGLSGGGKGMEGGTWGGVKDLYYTGPISPAPPDLFPRSFPANPDTLMARFRTVYAGRNIDGYRAVLADGFRFLFSAVDVTRLNLPRAYFTRDEDLGSTANMFSGDPVIKPDGSVPGVTSILIPTWSRSGTWTATGPADPDFPNTQRATYTVGLRIYRQAYATILLLDGQETFYVSARDSTCDGITRPYWQLRGQRDLTSITGKATEEDTWGEVKVLYE